ncbi:NAD(P)H-binding protein [Alphaproteobacteria bacterium]|nr:NAD(P)H-binding protein [Alphaproteobacteria bacterium]
MKTAIIFGSTGLIGSQLLNILLQDDEYSTIKAVVRSPISVSHKKLEVIVNDLTNISSLKENISGDRCFFCIGTTKSQTPNKNEYRRIEYDIPVQIASIAEKNNVNCFLYISSLGSNPNTNNTYLKNKGEVEEKLKGLNFKQLTIVKPSILLGKRSKFRLGEFLSQRIFVLLSFLFVGPLKKVKPINSKQVAKAMAFIAKNGNSQMIYESDALQNF